MKTVALVFALCFFSALIVCVGPVWIHHEQTQHKIGKRQAFTVNGVVRSLESDGRTAVIEHENIPDFMPAMIMPFSVKEPALLRGLHAGDAVRFELQVTASDSWISRIETEAGNRGRDVPAPSAVAPAGAAPEDIPPLANGQIVPGFTLTGQNGAPCRLTDFRGQAVLLTFVYTRCPLPNYCPLMSRNFAELQTRLGKTYPGRFHLITISFDPEHDTPAVLKEYAEAFTHDQTTWTLATGSPFEIQRVAAEFGLVYLPEAGAFTHDLRTALISPDGRLVHVWRSNVWSPAEVQTRVADVLARPAFAGKGERAAVTSPSAFGRSYGEGNF